MRYRLRTLITLTAVGPPALALIWFYRQWLELAAALALVSSIFVLWYWMLCTSQSNPKMRGNPNYDPPMAPPPGP